MLSFSWIVAPTLCAAVLTPTEPDASPARRVSYACGVHRYEYFSSDVVRLRRVRRSPRAIDLEIVERWPGYDEHVVSVSFPVPLDVRNFVPRTPMDGFAVGRGAGGRIVLYRWAYLPPAGAIQVERSRHPSILGVGVPHQPARIGPVGGTYVVPTARASEGVVLGALVSADLGVERVTAASADPEGRFVLFAGAHPTRIWRRSTDPGGEQTVVLDEHSAPLLARSRVVAIQWIQHAVHGRCYALSLSQVATELLVIDAENDGVFDRVVELQPTERRALGGPDLLDSCHGR
ncbi:MAG: hypothetical protein AAGB93_04270 [Planctomycetota bacterium]